MNRLLVVIMSLLLAVCLCLAACADPASTTGSTSSSSAPSANSGTTTDGKLSDVKNMTAKGQLPIVIDPVTLTVGIRQKSTVTDYVNNDYTKYLKEKTGIDIEFYFFPADSTEATQKLEMLVSSKSELPDIIYNLRIAAAVRDNYGAQGFILPLNDYIDKYAFFYNEMLATQDESIVNSIKKLGLSPDGKQYGFVSYSNAPTDRCYTQMHINTGWLKTLSLKKPTTTDEFYDVLKAFRDNDPNGNKQSDEIPLYGTTTWSMQVDQTLLQCFTYWNENGLHIKNGNIFPIFTTDEYKKGIEYMAKLCSEKLLSPLSFTQDNKQAKVLLNPQEGSPELVGTICGYHLLYFVAGENDHKYSYEALPLLLGPDGKTNAMYTPPDISFPYFITKFCENPEIAFRWLDFQMDDECMMTSRFGRKGDAWDYIDKGSAEAMFAGLGKKADRKLTKNIMGGTSNWNSPFGYIPEMSFGLAKSYSEAGAEVTQIQKDNDWFTTQEFANFYARWGKWPNETVGTINYTDAETLDIKEIRTVINTYVKEARIAFITGEKNISTDWDKYLSELNKMGLDKYIEITQKAYTRTYK